MSERRIQTEIALGLLFVVASAALLIYLGFREERALAQAEQTQHAEAIEVGGELFMANCARCHGENGEGIIGPPLNDEYFFTERLSDVGWEGTLEGYIVSTVSAGRPVSTRPEEWPGEGGPGYAMPSWSQDYGGPMRNDQIRDIAAYILNWRETALNETQVEILAVPGPASEDPVVRGRSVFVGSAGCAACHAISGISTGVVGPDLTNIGAEAATRVEGLSAEEYLRESILEPNAYIVEDFDEGVMPQDFDEKLSEDQLNDLIAFLLEQQ